MANNSYRKQYYGLSKSIDYFTSGSINAKELEARQKKFDQDAMMHGHDESSMESFLNTVEFNLDNDKLTDKQFRDFIANTIVGVSFERSGKNVGNN